MNGLELWTGGQPLYQLKHMNEYCRKIFGFWSHLKFIFFDEAENEIMYNFKFLPQM